MMKITCISTVEEFVLNPDYNGLRVARIEVWTDNPKQHYAYEPGQIKVWNDDELFMAVRDYLELEHCWFCYIRQKLYRWRINLRFRLYCLKKKIKVWLGYDK